MFRISARRLLVFPVAKDSKTIDSGIFLQIDGKKQTLQLGQVFLTAPLLVRVYRPCAIITKDKKQAYVYLLGGTS